MGDSCPMATRGTGRKRRFTTPQRKQNRRDAKAEKTKKAREARQDEQRARQDQQRAEPDESKEVEASEATDAAHSLYNEAKADSEEACKDKVVVKEVSDVSETVSIPSLPEMGTEMISVSEGTEMISVSEGTLMISPSVSKKGT